MAKLESNNLSLEMIVDMYTNKLDENYPINTNLQVHVQSASFKGKAFLDLDIRQLKEFIYDIGLLIDRRNGEITLEEPYGYRSYITIKNIGGGSYEISGIICSEIPLQRLAFVNIADEHGIIKFIDELNEEVLNKAG